MTNYNKTQSGRVIGAARRPTGPLASCVLLLGAGLLAASGVIHLHLWASGDKSISVIGPLFLAQGALAIVLALVVALVRRVFVASLGALFELGTLACLFVSVHWGLFGHRAHMSAPWATTSAGIEVLAAIALCVGGYVAVSTERAHIREWRSFKTSRL